MSYCIKAQSNTATNSTEAEFLAAVLAAKHAKFLRAILNELGQVRQLPTTMYEDEMSDIKIINTKLPPERPRHTDIQHFAIRGDIMMCHIPGGINPADDLTKPLEWVLSASFLFNYVEYSTMLNRGVLELRPAAAGVGQPTDIRTNR